MDREEENRGERRMGGSGVTKEVQCVGSDGRCHEGWIGRGKGMRCPLQGECVTAGQRITAATYLNPQWPRWGHVYTALTDMGALLCYLFVWLPY